MKTERRHDLQTNWLASHMAVWIEKFKPYTKALVLGAGILIIAVMITSYWSSKSSEKETAAWDQFTLSMTSSPIQAEGLDIDAKEYAGTTMAVWATLTWADYQLSNASATYLHDREGSRRTIKKVQEIYESLIDEVDSDELRNRAQLGLARALEMRNEPARAREAYQKVEGKLAGIAESRLQELNQPNVDKAINWLASAEAILPTAPSGPGTPGQRPLFGPEYNLQPEGEPIGDALKDPGDVDLLKAFEEAGEDTAGEDTETEGGKLIDVTTEDGIPPQSPDDPTPSDETAESDSTSSATPEILDPAAPVLDLPAIDPLDTGLEGEGSPAPPEVPADNPES